MASKAPPLPVNPWESKALRHAFPEPSSSLVDASRGHDAKPRSQDPLIFPGLYCPSGYDMMSILLQVRFRPNPLIELGAIDCSVALTLSDLELAGAPIVYASEGFCELTGYSMAEVLGRNCHFLQSPKTGLPHGHSVDKRAANQMEQAIRNYQEIQLEMRNYKKDGTLFKNILSIIPIELGSYRHRYAVGLHCEV